MASRFSREILISPLMSETQKMTQDSGMGRFGGQNPIFSAYLRVWGRNLLNKARLS